MWIVKCHNYMKVMEQHSHSITVAIHNKLNVHFL